MGLDMYLTAKKYVSNYDFDPEQQKLNREINRVLDTPEMRARIVAIGGEYTPNTVDQFNAFLKVELPRWAQIIQDTGAKVE